MTSTKARRRQAATEPRKRSLLWPLVGAAGAVALIVAVIVSLGGEADIDESAQVGSPVVAGEPLPRYDDATPSGGVGLTAPTVTGAGFDGSPASIAAGRPTAVVFLAHWCPHCQAEVPMVEAWLDGGGLPEGTDLIGVSTGVDRARANYPPQAWLEAEGWSAPLLVDSEDGAVAGAFGLSAFPFWVILDGDGMVVARVAGGVDLAAVGQALESLATG